ncbi:MAG: twin-arginine translocation signal domain-containing protein, partial [Desulfofustis sp.]|nr:twin-arginine translocation signal domain-containing protein [Desulfofustis sp.]
MKKEEMNTNTGNQEVTTGRRKFLKTAAAAAGAATVASLGFPMVSRAETTVLKMQGAWGAKDIFNDFAVDYVNRVNEMAGGRLKIEYLIAGAVVKAFQVQDGVHKGVIDAGHQVAVYWYGKSKCASLFGTGPVFGQNAQQCLA